MGEEQEGDETKNSIKTTSSSKTLPNGISFMAKRMGTKEWVGKIYLETKEWQGQELLDHEKEGLEKNGEVCPCKCTYRRQG